MRRESTLSLLATTSSQAGKLAASTPVKDERKEGRKEGKDKCPLLSLFLKIKGQNSFSGRSGTKNKNSGRHRAIILKSLSSV
jgi:hypothetical protein